MLEEIKYNKFPIYKFDFKWGERCEKGKYNENWRKGLDDENFWNGMSFEKMFKEEQTKESLEKFINDYWDKYVLENLKDKKFENPILTSKFVKNESWVGGWFGHQTFEQGLSDKEVLQSFEEFVRRYEHMQNEMEAYKIYPNYHCLMGAEDRWRWKGERLENGDYLDAPCRCVYCKKEGVVRISH